MAWMRGQGGTFSLGRLKSMACLTKQVGSQSVATGASPTLILCITKVSPIEIQFLFPLNHIPDLP